MKEKMDIKQLIQKIGVTRFIVIVLAGIVLLVLSLPFRFSDRKCNSR